MATGTTASATTIPITITSTKPAPSDPLRNMNANSTTEHFIRFPPYPPIPDGVKIVPFAEFKERGIRVQAGGEDNDTEVDGCGVPTVLLTSVHATDWCKTETKRARLGKSGPGKKRKKRKTGGGIGGGPNQVDWAEYWEDREASYRVQGTYDPHLDAYERLCQGAWDFKNGRLWPLAEKQCGPVFVWGEFLRFTGIPLLNTSGNTSTRSQENTDKKRKAGDDSDSDLDADDDDDGTGGILNPQNLSSVEAAMKAQVKGEAFLKDPALMLRVFLSSYARDRGIIWTDLNLTGAPTLMRFFMDFLVVNRVLPKREENAIKHESTRRIIDLALKELPLTSKLAKVWPDEFHKGCRELWGSRAEVFIFRTHSPMEGVVATDQEPVAEEAPEGWGTFGADKTDQDGDDWGAGDWNANAPVEWGGPSNSSTWASEAVTVSGGGEGGMVDEIRVVEVDNDGEITVETAGATAGGDSWDIYQPPSIFSFLGPTALPLTHTTGIVESSVRRIKAVLPPSTDTSKFPITKDVSAEAVEGYMRRVFGLVVFEPWVNWNKGEEPHLAMPRILELSRGAVKTEDEMGVGEVNAGESAPEPGALPPFDPHKDEISVLVDPSYLDLFSVGMGCLCTWVQMARIADFEPQDPKKKKKKNVKTERFWYVDEALRVVPSYYTYLG